MSEIMNLIGSAAEIIVKYKRAVVKPYQKIKHVMLRDGELLVPSDIEEYIFRLTEGWKIMSQNNNTIIIKKVSSDEKEIKVRY